MAERTYLGKILGGTFSGRIRPAPSAAARHAEELAQLRSSAALSTLAVTVEAG